MQSLPKDQTSPFDDASIQTTGLCLTVLEEIYFVVNTYRSKTHQASGSNGNDEKLKGSTLRLKLSIFSISLTTDSVLNYWLTFNLTVNNLYVLSSNIARFFWFGFVVFRPLHVFLCALLLSLSLDFIYIRERVCWIWIKLLGRGWMCHLHTFPVALNKTQTLKTTIQIQNLTMPYNFENVSKRLLSFHFALRLSAYQGEIASNCQSQHYLLECCVSSAMRRKYWSISFKLCFLLLTPSFMYTTSWRNWAVLISRISLWEHLHKTTPRPHVSYWSLPSIFNKYISMFRWFFFVLFVVCA